MRNLAVMSDLISEITHELMFLKRIIMFKCVDVYE